MKFEFSDKVKDLQRRLQAFMDEHIYPNEARYHHEIEQNRWQPVKVIEELKPKARAAGLWNLFLPHDENGAGLTNLNLGSLTATNGWALTGNAGTDPTNNFIGTTDNKDLNFRVFNRARRHQPRRRSPRQ